MYRIVSSKIQHKNFIKGHFAELLEATIQLQSVTPVCACVGSNNSARSNEMGRMTLVNLTVNDNFVLTFQRDTRVASATVTRFLHLLLILMAKVDVHFVYCHIW